MGDSNINTASDAVLTEEIVDDVMKDMSNEELYVMFAANLLAEKGYKDLNNPEGDKMIAELVPRIETFVTQELYFALPDKQAAELDGLMKLEVASADEVKKLYADAGLDMDEIVAKALNEFRDMYLGLGEYSQEDGE